MITAHSTKMEIDGFGPHSNKNNLPRLRLNAVFRRIKRIASSRAAPLLDSFEGRDDGL
jgi:hypothetical protein